MTKTTEENLSQSKYAEHRNVIKGYIGRLIKEGRLHLIKGKLSVEMSDAELDNKSNDEKAPTNDYGLRRFSMTFRFLVTKVKVLE